METTIARRYLNALVSTVGINELESHIASLEKIGAAFVLPKFETILNSPDVSTQQKVDLLLEIAGCSDKTFVNFIRLLAEKKKIGVIGMIAARGRDLLAKEAKEYKGVVYAPEAIDASTLKVIEAKLQEMLTAHVQLSVVPTKEALVKVVVPDMGIEAEFSKEKLKNQLIDHILRAI